MRNIQKGVVYLLGSLALFGCRPDGGMQNGGMQIGADVVSPPVSVRCPAEIRNTTGLPVRLLTLMGSAQLELAGPEGLQLGALQTVQVPRDTTRIRYRFSPYNIHEREVREPCTAGITLAVPWTVPPALGDVASVELLGLPVMPVTPGQSLPFDIRVRSRSGEAFYLSENPAALLPRLNLQTAGLNLSTAALALTAPMMPSPGQVALRLGYAGRPDTLVQHDVAVNWLAGLERHDGNEVVIVGAAGTPGRDATRPGARGGSGGEGGAGPDILVTAARLTAVDGRTVLDLIEVRADGQPPRYLLRRAGAPPLRIASVGGRGGDGGWGGDGSSAFTLVGAEGVRTFGEARSGGRGGDGGDGGPGGQVVARVSDPALQAALRLESTPGQGGRPGEGGLGGQTLGIGSPAVPRIGPVLTPTTAIVAPTLMGERQGRPGEASQLGAAAGWAFVLDRSAMDVRHRAPPEIRSFLR
jgi:hypothetical protein